MPKPLHFKFSGRVRENDLQHQVHDQPVPLRVGGPKSVHIPGVGYVLQYAPTVTGNGVGFDPSNDCQGSFTSARFQVHNNCYNYGVNIATNSFAHPGRAHGLKSVNDAKGNVDADLVVKGAKLDGLLWIGGPGTTLDMVREHIRELGDGHVVALLIAPANADGTFDGDFHWVRCDNLDLNPSTWSQKDGPDQVTNFDFAGAPIRDPCQANWTVNNGPSEPGEPDVIATYKFECYMFVPRGGVKII